MKTTIRYCFILLFLVVARPTQISAQSEKRIMEQICDTRPALKEVLLSAGVSATLMGEGPVTFFAPSESALATVPSTDPAKLNALLMNHIVPGKIQTQNLKDGTRLTTLGGATLSVFRKGNKIMINGVEISEADLAVRNGTIHTVRNWLVSPETKSGSIGYIH